MKTLHIFRHAKSGWDTPVERDFDRPINARGRRGAALIGAWAAEHKLQCDWITASPAVRVSESLDHFQPAAGLDHIEPHWDRRVYLASAATLLDLVHDTADSVDHLMLAGHNPGLEDLILMLVPDRADDALRAAIEEKLPTAALATLSADVDHWRDFGVGKARFDALIRPRDLDPDLGPQADH